MLGYNNILIIAVGSELLSGNYPGFYANTPPGLDFQYGTPKSGVLKLGSAVLWGPRNNFRGAVDGWWIKDLLIVSSCF